MRTLLMGAIFISVQSLQAEACSVGPFQWNWGENSQTTMSVEKGKGCAILVRSGGQSEIHRAYISQRPKNGTAEIRTANSPGYRSHSTFTGRDEFIATLCGKSAGRSGCSELRVQVTVN